MTSKGSELKWNHKPQASGFIAKFWPMVDKSIDHVIVKKKKNNNNNIYSLDVHFCWGFSENRAHEKETNKLCHHDVIFMVCTLIKHIALDQSACEKLSQKSLDFVLEIRLGFIEPDTSTKTSNTPVSKSVQEIPKRRDIS